MFYSDEGSNKKEEIVNIQPDNLFLEKLFSENIYGMRTPLVFMGGNILVDQLNGTKIAFCGGDVLKKTQIVWQACYEDILKKEKLWGWLKNI